MLLKQKELMDIADKIQRRKDLMHQADTDPRRTTYGVDEYVLLEYPGSALVKGRPPNKLLPNLRGPFRIISRIGDKYKLRSLIDGEEEETHISRIHPFHFDANQTSPRDVAKRDIISLFDIEEILDHSGTKNDKSSEIDFLVKFVGYDNEHNLWLPYSELRDTSVLHTYLIRNKMKRLIPTKFRDQYRA